MSDKIKITIGQELRHQLKERGITAEDIKNWVAMKEYGLYCQLDEDF